MTRRTAKHPADIRRGHSSIGEAAILLGVYVSLYLAVGGFVHALTSPNAVAAMAPGSGIVISAGEAAVPFPSAAEPAFASVVGAADSERIERPRECNLSAGIDTDCTF